MPVFKAPSIGAGWLTGVVSYRLMVAITLLLLQADHIRRVWSDYDPTLVTRLFCSMTKVASVSGMDPTVNPVEVVAHRSDCMFGPGAGTIYVYVYYGFFNPEPGEKVQFLAFKYRGATPRLTWQRNYRLQVTVDSPIEIERQLTRIDGVTVEYSLEKSPSK